MTHKDIFKRFTEYFPSYSKEADVWFPAGKNTIRVRLKNKREFIFQYDGPNDMRFETIDLFVERMKGEKK